MNPEDLYTLPLVQGVALSPDGANVAYVVTTMSADDDGYVGSIRVASVRDGKSRTYTHGTARDEHPQWSADGRRLLFISDRSGRRQVWLIDVDGGEPYQAPAIAADVSRAVFSPDGRWVAAVATPDAHRREITRRGWRRINRLRYRADGAGYLDDYSQLWLIDLQSGDARPLTDAGEVAAPAWSPDGSHIAYAAEHSADADSIWHTELWVVDVAQPPRPRKIFSLPGALEAPAWSPDGTRIAFTGHDDRAAYALKTFRLYSVKPDGSDLRCETESAEWTSTNVVLNDLESTGGANAPSFIENDAVVVLGTDRGSAGIFRIDRGAAPVRVTPETHSVSDFATAAGTLAIVASDSVTPPEIYVAQGGRPTLRRLTHETAHWCIGKGVAPAERFTVSGPAGPIDAWRLRGDGPRPGPCVLQIHGGPHACYGNSFFFEFHLLAAAGCDVVFCNPRGSQSYGESFARAIVGDWAAPAFDDCMAVVDAAIAGGDIDADRLGVAGGSYGGYLTAWIVSHTDRFAAAIAMRPTTNLASLWGTSEVGRMLEFELGGRPIDRDELYRRCSPLTYADRVKTPLLLVHAEHDFRCPIEQSEQFFVALRQRSADVEFLRFTEGDHGLSRSGPPRLRVARLKAIVDWFEGRLGVLEDSGTGSGRI